MALLQYFSVITYLYIIITMAQGTIMDRHSDLEIGSNGKVTLLDRRKRMDGCEFVCRCWSEVNGTIVNSMLPDHCLYVTQRVYIGCFEDKYFNRAMSSDSTSSQSMTISRCIAYCYDRGHMFAGLQYAKECYCGDNSYSKYGQRQQSDCHHNCVGDSREICGGGLRNSVYNTTGADELLCYKLVQLRGNNMQAVEGCSRIGYELADVNQALILDRIAEIARSAGIADSGYWLRVRIPLQNTPPTAGSCSTYKDNFDINDNECTYLSIKNDRYEVKKRRCNEAKDPINGYICQGRFEATRDTPTTPLVNIFTDYDDTTIHYNVTSGVTSTQQSEQDVSKKSNAVLPISITLAVAVVCITVLLIKRRTSTKSAPGTIPSKLEIHDVPKTQVNQQAHVDNSSNQHSNYGTSSPGDYAQLSDTVQKNHNPNFIVVEGDVYNGQSEYPMLPLSAKYSNAETFSNDAFYHSIGPQYDVFNHTEKGSPAPQYDVVNRKTEGSIDPQYDKLNREKEGSLDSQYDVLTREKKRSLDPQYDVLTREKEGSLDPQYDVLTREKEGQQAPVVYPEDVENEMSEDEYFYGDFKQ